MLIIHNKWLKWEPNDAVRYYGVHSKQSCVTLLGFTCKFSLLSIARHMYIEIYKPYLLRH